MANIKERRVITDIISSNIDIKNIKALNIKKAEAAKEIAGALQLNKNFSNLDVSINNMIFLGGNKIGAEDVKLIVLALKEKKALTTLNLSLYLCYIIYTGYNPIYDEGAKCVASFIADNESLLYLYLSIVILLIYYASILFVLKELLLLQKQLTAIKALIYWISVFHFLSLAYAPIGWEMKELRKLH